MLWERLATHYRTLLGRDFVVAARAPFWERIVQTPAFRLVRPRVAAPRRQAESAPSDEDLRVAVVEAERLCYLLHDKPVRLNDFQLRALDLIASTGRRGITQSDLAKQLDIDPRSLFHQLKAPLDYELVTRMPVSYQKTFTYTIYLARLAPQDVNEQQLATSTGDATAVPPLLPAMSTIRSRIMEIVEAAPQKTIASTEVYRLLGGLHLLKMYRRQINWLICHGHLECFVAGELGGVTSKILKFKKPLILQPPPGAAASAAAAVGKGRRPIVSMGAAVRTLPLDAQIHEYIDRSGSHGVVLTELMRAFGLGRKYCYRIAERLTSHKVYSNSRVIKTAEFDRKERRLRFYTQEGRTRSVTQAPQEDEAAAPLLGALARDSVNRARRGRELLNLINERAFVEVGKSLSGLLQSRLNERDYTMDVKTLKRLVEQLEAEGLVRVIIVILHGRQRMIVTKADIEPDDPRITEYVKNLETSRMELRSVKTQSPQATLETREELVTGAGGRLYRFNMQRSGYVFGIMKRCELLHRYLVEQMMALSGPPPPRTVLEGSWICETLPCFFKKIPFSLFRQIVGVAEMSARLQAFINSSPAPDLTLEELPEEIKNELHRRRLDRHKTVVKTLMDLMCQLGLAAPDNRYPSVAFRLPFQYKLSKTGVTMDAITGKAQVALDLGQPDGLEAYWDWLNSLSGTDSSQIAPTLPAVFKFACSPESWQVASPIGRALRTGLRLIASQELGEGFKEPEEREERLREIASDFSVDLEIIHRAYADVKAAVVAAKERRLSDLHNKRLSRRKEQHPTTGTSRRHRLRPRAEAQDNNTTSGSEAEEEEEEEGGSGLALQAVAGGRKSFMHDFSAPQLETIFVGYFVLHKAPFRNAQGNLQWAFLEQHMRAADVRNVTAEELRTFIGRYSVSFRLVKRLNRTLFRLRCIDALVQRGILSPLAIAEPAAHEQQGDTRRDLEERYSSLVGQYLALLPQLPALIRRLGLTSPLATGGGSTGRPQLQQQQREGKEGQPRIFLIGEPMVDVEQQYRKFARAQQMAYFASEKPFVIPAEEPPRPTGTPGWHALRKTLAIPSEAYDAVQTKEYLAPYTKEELDEALNQMLRDGLLSRSELARYKFRLAAGEFFLHEDFCVLADGLPEWPPSSSREERGGAGGGGASLAGETAGVADLMGSLLEGSVRLSFEIVGRGHNIRPSVTAVPDRQTLAPPHVRLDRTIDRALTRQGADATKPHLIWMALTPTGETRPTLQTRPKVRILRAACRLVYEELRERSGASRTELARGLYPILMADEVDLALRLLLDAQLLEREEAVDAHFCLPLR